LGGEKAEAGRVGVDEMVSIDGIDAISASGPALVYVRIRWYIEA
jgi:hypothetical protein